MIMTPAEIMKGLAAKNLLLTQKNEEYLELAEKRANAEREYKVAFAQKLLDLKSHGESVTMSKDIASGNKLVADLKFAFEVALAVERACLERIKDLRSQIDTYRSLLSWLKAELQSQ